MRNKNLSRLADVFGMELTHKASNMVLGHMTRQVPIGLGELKVSATITSSAVDHDFAALILHVSQDLHIAGAMGRSTNLSPILYLLDESKVSHTFQGLLEQANPTNLSQLKACIKGGIVRTYNQNLGKWYMEGHTA